MPGDPPRHGGHLTGWRSPLIRVCLLLGLEARPSFREQSTRASDFVSYPARGSAVHECGAKGLPTISLLHVKTLQLQRLGVKGRTLIGSRPRDGAACNRLRLASYPSNILVAGTGIESPAGLCSSSAGACRAIADTTDHQNPRKVSEDYYCRSDDVSQVHHMKVLPRHLLQDAVLHVKCLLRFTVVAHDGQRDSAELLPRHVSAG